MHGRVEGCRGRPDVAPVLAHEGADPANGQGAAVGPPGGEGAERVRGGHAGKVAAATRRVKRGWLDDVSERADERA